MICDCARADGTRGILFIAVGAFALLLGGGAWAAPITASDIHLVPSTTAGSGNGTIDLRLMTFSGSEVGNDKSGFDGDNAMTGLPQGGGQDISSFKESYVTTAAELQAYYTLNFGATTAGEIEVTLFLDLNETGATAQATNWMSTLDIVLKADIVDVCIDNRRTIVTRYWNPSGDRLFLFAEDADVGFDSVEIRPLSGG